MRAVEFIVGFISNVVIVYVLIELSVVMVYCAFRTVSCYGVLCC
jgi:hypothetical protein